MLDIGSPEILLGPLTPNVRYDGLSDVRLLRGGDTLEPGEVKSLRFDVRFDPNGESGPFVNHATATAEGRPSLLSVDDEALASFGLPSDAQPAIALTKTAGAVVASADGSLSVAITLTVTNIGDEELVDVQLEDDLNIFRTGLLIAVENLQSDSLTLNPNYNGLGNISLLDGDDSLAAGAAARVTFTLRFNPDRETDPFLNTAIVTGTGAGSGANVTDSADAEFAAEAGDPNPPQLLPPEVSVSKRADKDAIVAGDIVGYDVRVTNVTDVALSGVTATDHMPAGFSFVAGSAEIIRAGADSDLGTADDAISAIGSAGVDPVIFDAFDLEPNEVVLLRYRARVTTGVAAGDHTNTVSVSSFGHESVSASVSVALITDPLFEKSTIIGKVFHDRNGNFRQDEKEDEPGLPGIRLATVSGLTMETDAHGRYHLAEVEVERFARGANFIVKLDTATLPVGAKVASENPRVIRLTQATMSKLNFAISLPAEPCPRKVMSCVEFIPRYQLTNIDPVHFAVGRSVIPDDYANQLRALLTRFGGERDLQLVFVGHTDSDPVTGNLAAELGASGEGGNVVLSGRRALETCEFVRDSLNIPTSCENVEGRGSSEPLMSNATAAGKAGNRRVDIGVRYVQILRSFSREDLPQTANCTDESSPRTLVDLAGIAPPEHLTDTPETICNVELANSSATARHITVSGGQFGCDHVVDNVLPGRSVESSGDDGSVATVYASKVGDWQDFDSDCGGGISAGHYPIEIRSESGSVLHVTAAGDVRRLWHPTNNEHIVVTPYRDETDITVISALRISNNGIEPRTRDKSAIREVDHSPGGQPTRTNALTVDPRLDVLALDEAVVGPGGLLVEPVRFATYTNYGDFIESYVLEVYGSADDTADGQLLASIPATDSSFDRQLVFDDKQIDLTGFERLEYVLKASDCRDSHDFTACHVDVTRPRLLDLRKTGIPARNTRRPEDLWGKNNLAVQRIPIDGGRVRFQGKARAGEVTVIVGDEVVPVSADRTYVLESHKAFHRENLTAREPGGAAAVESVAAIPAVANDIRISGGPFGCGGTDGFALPGRSGRYDLNAPAITVVAQHGGMRRSDGAAIHECASQGSVYPIEIRTAEGSLLHVTEGGDVVQKNYPDASKNSQLLVVTPFRDHTDNTVVSALRIENEGLPFGPDNPFPAPSEPATLDAEGDYRFAVALINLTVGQNNLSGNVSPLASDDHFDETVFTDGRIALYAKGKIRGKYLITAQLDSTEDELKNLTDNLQREDPRRIFRQLDPDRYYPVYGDDSTTMTDVDSQGAMYVRVEWNGNTALWGNYNTGMTDTEFMQYNRSLYGAKLRHENQNTTQFGDARSELTVFASEAQSAAAHVTFKATGGSLYYLRDTDIVEGSEKAWIEVRRRDTQQVVEQQILIEGRDYEVDAIQGRVILSRPLSQVVSDRGPSIIRSTPLNGDDVFLLVDYEYVPDAFAADNQTYGGRGRVWIGDHLAVGASRVVDGRNGTDYDLNGVDVTLRAGQGTYLSAELVQSDARQNNANFISFDGGLSFRSQTAGGPGESLAGDARAFEGRINLAEFDGLPGGDVRAWWKQRDSGFSTGRLDQGFDIENSGIEGRIELGDNLTVAAAYSSVERERVFSEQITRVQADGRVGDLTAGVEIRSESVDVLGPRPFGTVSRLSTGTGTGDALLIGARVGYDVGDDNETNFYVAAQTVADDSGTYRKNDLASVGVKSRLGDDIATSVELSDGDRGSALTAGVEFTATDRANLSLSGGIGSGAINQFATHYALAEGNELYGSYAVDPDRTEGSRNLLTLGQRRAFGNRLALFAESQFGKDDRHANVAHVFGLDFDGIEDWRLSGSLQFSDVSDGIFEFERQALSLGAYLQRDNLKLSTRVEFREDEGGGVHTRQYVASNSLTRLAGDDRRWVGQLNVSWTDDELNGGRDARFVEFDLGHAYRPVKHDRLNLIAKYSFLYDLPTEGQNTSRPDERSHMVAVDGIFDLDERWELGGKLAVKKGELRSGRDTGPWREFGLRLAAVRARYHLNKTWDGLAEYRWLSDFNGEDRRHGALVGLYRHVGDHLKIGVGFNFSDFDSDLDLDGYNNTGWFVDFIGKY